MFVTINSNFEKKLIFFNHFTNPTRQVLLVNLAAATGLNPIKTGRNLSRCSMQKSSCPATYGAERPQVMPIYRILVFPDVICTNFDC